MKAKDAKRVWNRVFPLEVGDRVKITKVLRSDWSVFESDIIGAYGRIEEIEEGEFFPYLVTLEGDKESYAFKQEELERVEKERTGKGLA